MPSYGHMEDGTPFVTIGADEPASKEFIVHTQCSRCGNQHYFDFWSMFRGETIVCEHCGNEARRGKMQRWTGDGWEECDD